MYFARFFALLNNALILFVRADIAIYKEVYGTLLQRAVRCHPLSLTVCLRKIPHGIALVCLTFHAILLPSSSCATPSGCYKQMNHVSTCCTQLMLDDAHRQTFSMTELVIKITK
jgi:hypothetical protein